MLMHVNLLHHNQENDAAGFLQEKYGGYYPMKKFEGYEKGINFGGWLSQCDHTKERYDTFIVEKDFEEVKNRGYDHVRVPIDYELFENKDMSFKEGGFAYIEFAIDMCRKYGLNMVLDLHRTPGYSFDPGHNEAGFFENEKYQNHFYLIWETLARRFGNNADMLTFEILNEVTKKEYSDTWNRISTECIRRIRTIAPDIRILLGGYYNNSIEALKDLPAPYDDKIIYNFHCYEPLIFTHQGAYWIPSMDTSFRCPFKMTYREYVERGNEQLGDIHVDFSPFDPDSCPGEDYFDYLLKEAVEVAKERDVALYCGEYGVIDLADEADRRVWYDTFHKVMDKYNICRAVWNYKEMDFEVPKDL